MNFEKILLAALIVTGLVAIVRIWLPKSIKQHGLLREVAGCFPVLLLVFVIRSFAFEAFRIPSGSMKPVFLEGDYIAIDKFSHGLRWPISSKRISQATPQQGDVVVFRGEVRGKKAYVIKRIIGLPGDHIQYKNKTLTINGKQIEKSFLATEVDYDLDSGNEYPVDRYHESLGNKKYHIYNYPFVPNINYPIEDIVVPAGQYFVMGNNRDNSHDSRFWGLLDDDQIVGRARLIVFSLHPKNYKPRWGRFWESV